MPDILEQENRKELSEPNLILCEGKGDAAFFRHLLEHYGIRNCQIGYPDDITAGGHTGKDGFGHFLLALEARSGSQNVTNIIIARDSDDDPDRAFADVCRQITETGKYTAPPQAHVRTGATPTISVILIPSAADRGNLETLLWRAVKTHAVYTQCLNNFFGCCGYQTLADGVASKKAVTTIIATFIDSNPSCTLANIWSNDYANQNPFSMDHAAIVAIADLIDSLC